MEALLVRRYSIFETLTSDGVVSRFGGRAVALDNHPSV
jgi:hypothetical protein